MSKCKSCYHQIKGIECSARDGIECCINRTWRSWKPITEKEPTKYKCHYSECVSYNKTYSGNCTYRSGNEIPTCKYYKQYKEQQMSFKPTSKFTLKNLAECVYERGCDDAGYQYFKMFYEIYLSDRFSDLDIAIGIRLTEASKCYKFIMADVERIKFCLEHGFIEEVNKLKPCPFCESTKTKLIKTLDKYIRCEDCGTNGPDGTNEYEAIKAWNKRS